MQYMCIMMEQPILVNVIEEPQRGNNFQISVSKRYFLLTNYPYICLIALVLFA